jgi:lipopolysaccharide export system protein LptA
MRRTGFIIAALACALPAFAAEVVETMPSDGQATVITSEKLTFDYQKQYAVFEVDVEVTDGDMTLTADKLAIWFNDDNEINLIKAEGNVHIVQEDKTANAGEAVYEVATGKIVLTENPRLQRGRHYLEGDKITYMRNADLLVVEPQPRLVIYPDDEGGAQMNLFGE